MAQRGYGGDLYRGERISALVGVELADDRKPWERQPSEPSRWYGRFFEFYLPLGSERSIMAAQRRHRRQKDPECKHYTATSPSWRYYARIWRWLDRSIAYDNHMMNALQVQIEDERFQMFKRHREQAVKWSDAAMGWLDKKDGHRIGSGSLALRAWKESLDVEARSLIPPQLLKLLEMSDLELQTLYEGLLDSTTTSDGPEAPKDQRG